MKHLKPILLAALTLATIPMASHAETVRLSGVLLDDADDNRFFTRLGGVAKDVITYEGLEPGQDYVLVTRLINAQNPDDRGEAVTTEFTAEAASGEVTVKLPVPKNKGDVNIDYVTETSLSLAGSPLGIEGYVGTMLGDPKDPARTIQVHAVQGLHITSVTDAEDGDAEIPGSGGVVTVKVAYENMVEGYPYTFWGQLLSKSGQAIGVFASIPDYAPESKAGEVELRFEVPDGFEGISVYPSVGVYHKKRVDVRDDGVLVWHEDAPNPVMIASDTDTSSADREIKVGVPFKDQP